MHRMPSCVGGKWKAAQLYLPEVEGHNEQLAEEIAGRLSGHAQLWQRWLDQMTARLPK
jgi:hypothetical protein